MGAGPFIIAVISLGKSTGIVSALKTEPQVFGG